MMPNAAADNVALASRHGLPDALRGLLRRFPRERWPGHANIGAWSQFWLDRHDLFRQLSDTLQDGCRQLLDRKVDSARFRQWALPRLDMYVGHLDLHHRIEEFHIFPAFAAIEPSLDRGYALLEADHEVIHPRLPVLHASGQTLARLDATDRAAAERATAALLDGLAALAPELTRHLTDEEDLLIPVVLTHGEAALHLH